MPDLDAESWRRLEPLLERLLDLPTAERRPWLATLSAESPALAADLEGLLREQVLADERSFLADQGDVSLVGLELGGYRLERPLGKGGMGTVWLAVRIDGRFEGKAAVKLLNLALVSATGQERFRREGSVLARLDHPGIAKLLDAGVSATGQPYLLLEYVEGVPIDEFVRDRKLGLHECVRLFLQVVAAVGNAHSNLIIHRDIKPSNILVRGDGVVKLLDFGIAKLLDNELGAERSLTVGGQAFTPLYAAPEQVRGETLTTATDIYALGVLLYLLVGGRHPTAEGAHTQAACLTALFEVEPGRLGVGDLDNVLGKALRKGAGERYQSVNGLAEDLAHYLRDEPVSARPPALSYRVGKFVHRHRAAVVAAGLAVGGLVAATLFSLSNMQEARVQRDVAVREARRADAQVEFQSALLTTVGDQPMTMRQVLDAGREVLEKRYADDPITFIPLLLQLSSSYAELGDTQFRRVLLSRAEALAVRAGTRQVLGEVRCLLADNLRTEGEYRPSERALEAAEALLGPAADPSSEATCLAVRAQLMQDRGRDEACIAAAQRGMAVLTALGKTHDQRFLNLLVTMAGAVDSQGRPREAISIFRRVIDEMNRSGRGSLLRRSAVQDELASTLEKVGETAACEETLREVLARSDRSDGSRINWGPVIHYAEAASTQGRAEVARAQFSRIVAQAVADANLYWEGRGLFGLARAQVALGQLAQARRSRTRLEEIIARYPHVRDTEDRVPDGQTIDGLVAMAEGDPGRAHDALLGALHTNGYFEGKRKRRLRPVVVLAGESALGAGKIDAALDLARQAYEIARVDAVAETHSAYVGEALLLQGRALLARGDERGARASLVRAVVASRNGAGPGHRQTQEAERLLSSLAP
jgi:tRNA A-37 threonylcarbamoyl transferase component Bud32/tetratricopeptide (TPR) repeat protein